MVALSRKEADLARTWLIKAFRQGPFNALDGWPCRSCCFCCASHCAGCHSDAVAVQWVRSAAATGHGPCSRRARPSITWFRCRFFCKEVAVGFRRCCFIGGWRDWFACIDPPFKSPDWVRRSVIGLYRLPCRRACPTSSPLFERACRAEAAVLRVPFDLRRRWPMFAFAPSGCACNGTSAPSGAVDHSGGCAIASPPQFWAVRHRALLEWHTKDPSSEKH